MQRLQDRELYDRLLSDPNHYFECTLTIGESGLLTDMNGSRITFGSGEKIVRILIDTGGAEVRDGILNHQTSGMPYTLEGKIVRICDKIAYMHHDMDDAIKGEILCEEDIPAELRKTLGNTTTKRLDCFIHDIIINSLDKDDICMSEGIGQAMKDLRLFMFENVYHNPKAKGEEGKAERLVENLYQYYLDHFDTLPEMYLTIYEERGESRERIVCDYISAMSDKFANHIFADIYLPDTWKDV